MDSLRIILSFLFKLIIVLIFVTAIIWLFSIFLPKVSLRSILSSSTSTPAAKDTVDNGWLPAPGSFGSLFKFKPTKTPSETENVFSYNNTQFDSQVDYITYTSSGMQVVHPSKNSNILSGNTLISNYSDKSKYLRNLSIYEGGHIYTGISFYGEAKSTMFKNDTFPIIIVDSFGKIVSVTNVEKMNVWATPGWTRFHVRINSILPNKVPCTMIFQSANTRPSEQPVRVAIPVLCN
ncbi:MAG: hypothetical protein WCT07_02240 [Candidatus Paceibacterota bacterium]|jgi:hypothetical protein